jgi:hypothetical protein
MSFYTVLGVMFWVIIPSCLQEVGQKQWNGDVEQMILHIAWRMWGRAKIHADQLVVGKFEGGLPQHMNQQTNTDTLYT